MHILKKILKVLSYVVVGVVLLLLIVSIFIDPIAKNYLENQINDADQGQYSAQIEKVNISILRGNIILNGISLQTDTTTARENETPVVNLEAGEISVEGLSWLKYLLSDKLDLNRVSLLDINLEAKVRTTEEDANQGDQSGSPFEWEDLDIYPQIKEHVDRIHLEDLRFGNLDITLINIGTQDTLQFSAGEFNLFSDDILIDADRVLTDNRAFYASKIDIKGKEVVIDRTGNDSWNAEFGVIEFDTRESEFGIFSENAHYFIPGTSSQDTVIFASIQEFALNDLDLNRVQEDSVARIRDISINTLSVINNIDVEEEEVEKADKKDPGFDVTNFTLGDNLPELLDRVIIREISLQNISYQELDQVDVKKVNFSAENIVVDNKPAFSDNRFLHAEQLSLDVQDLEYSGGEIVHQINLGELQLQMKDGTGNLELNEIIAKTGEQASGEMAMDVNIPGFNIRGIDTRKLPEKIFSVDSISMEYPNLAVNMGGGTPGEEGNGSAQAQSLDLYPAIQDMLSQVHINKIALIQGDIRIAGLQDNPNGVHLPAVYVQLDDILIAEGTAFSGGRVLHSGDIAVRLENINYQLPDNVHFVNLDLFRMSTREKFVQGSGLSYGYNQNYRKTLKAPESNQLISFSNKRFSINNLEFQDLIQQNGFFASTIKADGIDVEVFSDKNYPAEEEEEDEMETYPVPQQMIRDIGMPVYLGELSVNDVNFRMEEIAEGGEEPGIITVNDINLSVRNFTNVRNILQENSNIKLNIDGLLMGDGQFYTEVNIPMLGEKRAVHVKGGVDSLDLTKFNRYTEYTTRFGIESGMLYRVLWDFEAGPEMAAGEFGLSYEALDVQLSKPDSPESAGTIYQIGAYLANALVLDSDIAEARSDPPKTAEFEREKEEEESFIEHYVASLMAGFVEVMGFPLSIINP